MKAKKIKIDLVNFQEARNVVLAIFALVLLAIFPAVQTMIAALLMGSMLYAADGGVISGIGFGLIANSGTIAGAVVTLLSWLGITVSVSTVATAIVLAGLVAVAGGLGLA
ncbi:hypothetical protein EWF20_06300 [Sulfolobus sp. S-194]|uniref:hypothetical protein n=1 Tax=Sulfolobus sp. S-194 TaxID=2512240 RepID=UPI0014371EFD|nr:hypothetical protein [Sulfolobus sp. S-194]QIW23804.1 hypothetical protein EWF20_06300 [Sulfolobus sp. S-194]